jgi:hypothetical protein
VSALLTVNGASVVRGAIERPRIGAWHGDLVVDAQDVTLFQGAITIAWGDSLTMKGSAFRVGVHHDTIFLRVIGGAGGLGTILPPKAYQNVTAQIPLLDIAAGAGETISSTVGSDVLGVFLPMWVRLQQGAGMALAALLRTTATPAWRVLSDGTLWAGIETWPEATLEQWDEIEVEPHQGRVLIGTDTPTVDPGSTFQGGRVSFIEHQIDEGEVRHVLWFDDSESGGYSG